MAWSLQGHGIRVHASTTGGCYTPHPNRLDAALLQVAAQLQEQQERAEASAANAWHAAFGASLSHSAMGPPHATSDYVTADKRRVSRHTGSTPARTHVRSESACSIDGQKRYRGVTKKCVASAAAAAAPSAGCRWLAWLRGSDATERARRKTGKRRYEAQVHPPQPATAESEAAAASHSSSPTRQRIDGRVKDVYLGVYTTIEAAAMAVDRATIKFYGNDPPRPLNVRARQRTCTCTRPEQAVADSSSTALGRLLAAPGRDLRRSE